MSGAEMRSIRAKVRGRVQGVGFRWFVLYEARALGLTGMVRNDRDGNVEVTAEGEKATLDELIKRLKEGPSGANVTGVDIEWEQNTGKHSVFEIQI